MESEDLVAIEMENKIMAARQKQQFLSCLLALFVVTSIAISFINLGKLPSVITADNFDSSVFSGERARIHLNEIAQSPRPFNSDENKRVNE